MASALKTPIFLLLVLVSAISARAQEPPTIEVSNVRFDRTGDDWLVATVEITPDRNPLPDARDRDFVDDVELTLSLCYEVDNQPEGQPPFTYYRSSVRIVSMEHSKRYTNYFFLPSVLRDRDELKTDPFAWMIEMKVSGVSVPMAIDQAGGQVVKGAKGYGEFLNHVGANAPQNDGILVPIYLAPDHVVNSFRIRSSEIPAFYRFEPKN
tara:strand:- start:24830 stop:25456 length:627 start_codon:yes stop_codon:yes gene_type:complete